MAKTTARRRKVDHYIEFKVAEVLPLIAHAVASSKHMLTFEERMAIYGEDKWGHPQPGEDEKVTAALWLVKDSGAYLMSNGVPRDVLPSAPIGDLAETRCRVAYAEGLEPDAEDSWDKCRAILGGDDFCFRIEIDQIQRQINANGATGKVVIGVRDDAFLY